MLERKRNLTNNAIDFVITWVNGNDPEWRKEKSLYSGDAISNSFELDIREERYRDWDNLQYWFRGVENLHHGYEKFILLLGGICRSG